MRMKINKVDIQFALMILILALFLVAGFLTI